jgi:hypothetical protein
MAQAAEQPPPPTPEHQYLIAQAEKALADAEKIKTEAQKIAAEFSPEMIQAKQAGEAAKIDADIEKARLQAETARVNAEVARIKALADVEMEREKARAAVESSRPEQQEIAPMIVVEHNGDIMKKLTPSIQRMTEALENAGIVLEGMNQKQTEAAKAKVIVRKGPDGTFIGERVS